MIDKTLTQHLRDAEREYIMRLLFDCGGRITEAARRAGRNRTQFYRCMSNAGIDLAVFKLLRLRYNSTNVLLQEKIAD